MTPFLKQVAKKYITEYSNGLDDLLFVFPNRRMGVFFKKYLAELTVKPMLAPELTTISDLVQRLSNLKIGDKTEALFKLYEAYHKIDTKGETFDEFYFWGDIILSDFNEIDKFCIDAKQLYSNIEALKELDVTFDYLTPEQQETIEMFWSGFKDKDQPEYKKRFLQNWQMLFPVYEAFTNRLKQEGEAYEGLVYRDAAEKCELGNTEFANYAKVVFVGFNVLSASEEKIFTWLHKTNKAQFCWDMTNSIFWGAGNPGTDLIAQFIQRFPQQPGLLEEENSVPSFDCYAFSSNSGQAHEISSVLKSWSVDADKDLTKTAVVLCDEGMLIPVLHGLPETIDAVNITMGYQLKNTVTYSFVDTLLRLVKSAKWNKGRPMFYYKDLISLCSSVLIQKHFKEEAKELSDFLIATNAIFLSQHGVQNNLTKQLFETDNNAKNLLNWIQQFLTATSESDEEEVTLESEISGYISTRLTKLLDLLQIVEVELSFDVLISIIKSNLKSGLIPFEGEPLSGIQIMGLLETRGLDFENIVLLSFNEDIIPRKTPNNTFIPGNLRQAFGLTTAEYNDAMYTYYFYRLIQRAENVALLYNSASSGMSSGEPSRFVKQLSLLYNIDFDAQEKNFFAEVESIKGFEVKKSPEVLQEMDVYLSGPRSISPSALNTYLNCPLKFYYSYVKYLRKEDEVQEEVDSRAFGDIFHDVVEKIYLPLQGSVITSEMIDKMLVGRRLEDMILKSIGIKFFNTENRFELTGQLQIILEVLKKYVVKMLLLDKSMTPFVLRSVEEEVQFSLAISEEQSVRLKGKIDRVDEVNEKVRIIDYKTGSKKENDRNFSDIASLFLSDGKRKDYIFQTFFYLLLYKQKYGMLDAVPGVYQIQDFYSEKDFSSEISQKEGRGKSKVLLPSDFNDLLETYTEELKKVLVEIFLSDTPFVQTDEKERCSYCDYAKLCRR